MQSTTDEPRSGGFQRTPWRPGCAGPWPRAGTVVPAMLAAWAVGLGAPASATGAAPPGPETAPASSSASSPAPSPAAAPASEAAVPPAVRLANGLLDTIPPGARLAIRPLDPRETGLPQEVGSRLYESMLNAVHDASRGRGVKVLARERLSAIYRTLEEFDQGDVESMLRNARADVEIICKSSPAADGVTLSCSAVRLEETGVTVAHAMARFPLERAAEPLELAVARIARHLAEGAPATGPVERVMLMDTSLGARGDLGVFLGRRLEGEVIRRMAERARREDGAARVATAIGTEPAPRAEERGYGLEGDLWRLDAKRLRLEVRLRDRGRSLVAAGADIAVSSLPPRFGPGRGGGEGARQRYEAVAEAVVSARLDRASALRAARNLARARVVARALDLPPPGVAAITGEADAIATFAGYLDAGLPVDERHAEVRPEGGAGGGERVAVRLAARVKPLGRLVRPAVRARLGHAVYRAMEPMRLEIRSEEKAHLGVFAWGADDRVVRLYPRGKGRMEIGAGETLDLPRRGEGRILSAPMPIPGNREDHEALVVVATARSMDFAGLAPAVGASVSETMGRAVDGSGFLTALAGQDPARMAVIWLPYQVHD